MQFDAALSMGKTGESLIASYFKKRGFNVLPVYEKTDQEFKGPTIYTFEETRLIAPDMIVFGKEKCFWIEAKHKSAFTWHRATRSWNTGIDRHHFQQYLQVMERSPWPVWLLFLHRAGTAKDTPDGLRSPCGLFGNELGYLASHIHHQHDGWGKNGMVYWALETLKKLDSELCHG